MRTITLMTSAQFALLGEAHAPVALPHTWNAFDGQDGGNDYHCGIGTYIIDLPDPTPGKKQFIELQGANHVATVYCNGRELGTHKGGFSTFRYELTPVMKNSGNKPADFMNMRRLSDLLKMAGSAVPFETKVALN